MHDFLPAQKASIFRLRGTESVWEKEKWQKKACTKEKYRWKAGVDRKDSPS